MKLKNSFSISVIAMFIIACNTTKKTTVTSISTTPAPVVSEVPNNTIPFMFDNIDYVVPGNEELNAIQKRLNTVTLEQLKQGHEIYTKGACINCHGPQSIKRFSNEQWKMIINDMAERSSLTNEQKDAVYTYVLAIKAKQSKE